MATAMEDLFGESDEEEAPQQDLLGRPVESGLEDLEDEVVGPATRGDVGRPEAKAGAAAQQGLFGSDDEDDDEDAFGQRRGAAGSSGDDEDGTAHAGSRAARDDELLGPPLEASAPLLAVPPTGTVCLLRTTNVVSIHPTPFDPITFLREPEVVTDDTGRQRVRLATGVIRWRLRTLPDGRVQPESNARIVRWEDGSVQLLLGDEALDVAQQDITPHNNYLFMQLPGLLQGMGHLSTRLALRPASLDSGLHRRLQQVLDKRNVKVNKVVSHAGLQNPELDKARWEAAEEKRIKGRGALQRQQDKVMARAYGGRAPRGSRLAEEQDWDGAPGAFGDDDDDDDLTAAQRARVMLARDGDAPGAPVAGKRGAPSRRAGASKRRRSGSGSNPRKLRDDVDADDEEDEEEEEEELMELGEEDEEPEYESSGSGDDEEDQEEEEEEDKGGRGRVQHEQRAPPPPKQAPPPPPSAAVPGLRQRRGVVLSDDED